MYKPLFEQKKPFEEYKEKGFFVIKEFITCDLIDKIYKEVLEAKDSDVFFDRQGNIRRIEKIYNKGEHLKELNILFKKSLKDIFQEDFNLFKDKFNAKPPGGEGFFAHYDGIFIWEDENHQRRKGWHEYSDNFINTLVAFDDCNLENGCLELSNENKGSFEDLLNNTKKNGTPDLLPEYEENLVFQEIILKKGDSVFFSSKCPHRSKKNFSKDDRKIIYYTYNPKKDGDFYSQYFYDKDKSKNKNSKSLSGQI